MIDFIQYVFNEVKNSRLSKSEAVELIKQFHNRTAHDFVEERRISGNAALHSPTALTEWVPGSEYKGKERVITGIMHLEMLQKAAVQIMEGEKEDGTAIRLRDVRWSRPVPAERQPEDLRIGLFKAKSRERMFEIRRATHSGNSERSVYCQGSMTSFFKQQGAALELSKLQSKYQLQPEMSNDTSDQIYAGQEQWLARLTRAVSAADTDAKAAVARQGQGQLERIIQAAVTIVAGKEKAAQMQLFSLDEMIVMMPMRSPSWIQIRLKEADNAHLLQLDMDCCDDRGEIVLSLKGLSLFFTDISKKVTVETEGTLLLLPAWREEEIGASEEAADYTDHWVVLAESEGWLKESVESSFNGARCIVLPARRGHIGEMFEGAALQIFNEIRQWISLKPQGKLFIQVAIPANGEDALLVGLTALLRTAKLENPQLQGQLIESDDAGLTVERLKANLPFPSTEHIVYRDGKRFVAAWTEGEPADEITSMPWKDGGIYLITGGAGKLGLLLAKEIAGRIKDATLILAGRSTADAKKDPRLARIRALGATVEYREVDVADERAVTRLIGLIVEQFGGIDGIIHAAGIHRDNFILKKSEEEFSAVLSAKVSGLVNLDRASSHLKLDFFIIYSSVAGVLGNPGQADYSSANAFVDGYVLYRNGLAALNQRHGRTVSVNWPLWKEGGMRVGEEVEKLWTANFGITAMESETGFKMLYSGLSAGVQRFMPLQGKREVLRKSLLYPITEAASVQKTQPVPAAAAPSGVLLERTLYQLKVLFADTTKLDVEEVDGRTSLERYGIDSIMVTQLNDKLANVFTGLSKTLFYEYQTLSAIAEALTGSHQMECMAWTGLASRGEQDIGSRFEFPVLTSFQERKKMEEGKRTKSTGKIHVEAEPASLTEPIAIIGMSGRFPQSRNLEDYWINLLNGRDCITEIPEDRWPLDNFYHPNPQEAVAQGKSYSKWGGFLHEPFHFDPLFFHISPREAISMDPQERIFIQSCWEALEDAGYTRESLAVQFRKKVGVFAGITKTGFNLYGPDLWKEGERTIPFTSFSSVANRISYLFNLQGPSMPIDTMCSSSLTAIHEACEHILHGDCDMAFAGGVNLYLHPSNYVELCAHHMLSSDGQCKSFGSGGNGFVPGEGVGVVVLKRLSQAIADGDQIHALIRGTSINHGGKTNGYTVPNPTAQGELISAALDKAGINARAVSYIEAHGTGTALGDPIEITGLTQAFRNDTQETGFCAIGSVKSNIGHAEAAAGIAGVLKIVLQMKHGKLVPSLHAKQTNPNIDFKKTPFVLQQKAADWTRQRLNTDLNAAELPRIAGISSFGAGGANAHIVIEEYIPGHSVNSESSGEPSPALIVLSAKNEERLREQAVRLLAAVRKESFLDTNLAAMSYTLQVGREPMEERMAIIAKSVKDFEDKLAGFVEGRSGISDLYRGRVKPDKDTLDMISDDEEMQEGVARWMEQGKYSKLLKLWVKGLVVDWSKLYGDKKPGRMSLPTYPFACEPYRLPLSKGDKANPGQTAVVLQKHASVNSSSARIMQESTQPPEMVPPQHALNSQEPPMRSVMLVPLWDSVMPKLKHIDSPEREGVMVVGGTEEVKNQLHARYPNAYFVQLASSDSAEDIVRKFASLGAIHHLIWIGSDRPVPSPISEDILIEQQCGVIQVFRIIKALLASGYGNTSLNWTLIMTQTAAVHNEEIANPTHAGVYGLIGSMAKEYPNWKVRAVDMEPGLPWPLDEIFGLDADGEVWFYRKREWQRQRLVPVTPQSSTSPEGYRRNGVYIVIGGAGGIGEVWSEYMIRTYGAQIVWIGRRPMDDALQNKLARLASLGRAPWYIAADAADYESLKQAVREVKRRYPQIHGVVHSAIVLRDQSLMQMDEEQFRAGLRAKVDVSVSLAQVFEYERMDFVLFFSGMMSFAKNPGQSNYSAGCTFKDAYAAQLAKVLPCAVKVMNWGYWGSVGIVASKSYKDRMGRAGIGSIEPQEAMEALEALMSGPFRQLAFIKTNRSLTEDQSYYEARVETYRENSSPRMDSFIKAVRLPVKPKGLFKENVEPGKEDAKQTEDMQFLLLKKASELLGVQEEDLDAGAELNESGFDPGQLADFVSVLNQELGLSCTIGIFEEYSTLNRLASLLASYTKGRLK